MREAASFIASRTAQSPVGLLSSTAKALRTAFHGWQSRRQLKHLADIDDHLLADIGLTREDVRWALDLPFSSDPGLELQCRALRNRHRGWRE